MDWSEVFSISIYHGYIPQIIFAEALYVLRLPRRSRFWVRFGVGLPVCALLTIVLPNMVAQLTAGFFSIIIFLLTFGLCCLLFKSKWTQVLFCCVSAQFTQNLSYNIEGLIEMPIGDSLTMWGIIQPGRRLQGSACHRFAAERGREHLVRRISYALSLYGQLASRAV